MVVFREHTLTGHSNKVMAARFMGNSGGAGKVVSGSQDRTLKIWDLRSRSCAMTIFAGSVCNDVVATDWLATGIISGHFDKKIRFWDARHQKNAVSEVEFQGKITSLSLSKDLKYLLACVRDDSLKLLDLQMNQVLDSYSADGFHVSCDWCRAAMSPDCSLVAAGSSDGCVYVWNVSSGRLEKVLREHGTSVIACTWQPGGNFLASCDKNKRIVLWSPV
ncbi:unnamed protein product [Notodromas monacha]|uniref:Uncharacterized protein n=1 Tax=Notodromas monacha TaxID=399045 RepID=A0A7R9GEM6_9CRUS|nr:unnamed protein product [Notodromas monacha]CAG0919780.1 unnamed protein product [Notodromas monacha]